MAPLKSLYERYKVGGLGNSLVVQWLGLGTITAGAPAWELRSHKLRDVPPSKKKRIKNEVRGTEV